MVTCFLFFVTCASDPQSNVTELENKGSVMGVRTPEWVQLYVGKGLSAVQAQKEYQDKYCIIGEESGVNRQFVLSWADAASAQQRIGALLRTNIAGRYQAAITATAGSGAENSAAENSAAESSAQFRQEIDNALNAVVNVSYSGAQREADWWSLRRRYDPDNKEVYADEYTAYVLYTVPKAEMNRQLALALETSASKDSALYDITITLARDILLQGYEEGVVQSAAVIQQSAGDSYDPPGSVVARALDEINLISEYAVGREVAAAILSEYSLWNGSPALTNYVNRICSAIVINSPEPAVYNGYHIAILDSDTINAFATPGGHIFVTRGLVSAARSEDALAAVIAHEIAHIQLKHGIRAIQSGRDTDEWFRQFSASGAQTIAASLNAGFSQIQEFDADISAISLLAATGYSPLGLVDILQELEKIQPNRAGGFNATHPTPTSRLVNAKVASTRYPNAADTRTVRQKRFAATAGAGSR
jgi:hypothetical protein